MWCHKVPSVRAWQPLLGVGGSPAHLGGIGRQGREQIPPRPPPLKKKRKKKGNMLNKLLPLLWSGNRGRGTALPSALNKHCGPTTTYKPVLDVWRCRLEERERERGVGRCPGQRRTPPSVAYTETVAKTRRHSSARRGEKRTVSVGKMWDFVSVFLGRRPQVSPPSSCEINSSL